MRKIIAASSVIIGFLSFTAFAVEADKTQFSIGIGLNVTKMDSEGAASKYLDEEAAADLTVAAKVEYGLDDQWSLRSGIWLQEKSARFTLDKDDIGTLEDVTLTNNTIYATVPLTLQYKVNDMFSLFGGYAADFRINDYCSMEDDDDKCTIYDDTKSVVHTAQLGASIWANKHLQIDLSYTHGLSDVYDQSVLSYKLHTLSAMLFLKF